MLQAPAKFYQNKLIYRYWFGKLRVGVIQLQLDLLTTTLQRHNKF